MQDIDASDAASTSRRQGRRGRRPRREATASSPRTARYRRLTNPFAHLEVLDEEQIERIHLAAVRLLADAGIRVLLQEARDRFAAAGCTVEDDAMVRLDPDLVANALETAPQRFAVLARADHRSFEVGGRHVAFMPVGGPPHATDLERGRRTGSFADFLELLRLSQHFDVLHGTSPLVEPQDVPLHLRHLEVTRALLTLTDKVPFIYSRGDAQIRDAMEVVRIAHGVDEETFRQAPRCYTVINTNSPRQLDIPMAIGTMRFAAAGQLVVVTPFTLAGAMAPVTLAGALTLQHAENLATITLTQLVAPGSPVMYGGFTSNVDMRSGAPAFGTPEAAKAAFASGQLARHLGLPWRSSAVSTANGPDAQAGYETMMNTLGALFAGANLIFHAAGWTESGLNASYEKFILDVEMLQMFAELVEPLAVGDDDIAADAIRAVSPGAHFFGAEHTLARYSEAFYEPIVFSRQNYGQWEEAGKPTAAQRAVDVWKRIVEGFEPPPMEDARRAELDGFVARRTEEGGALPDG
jgi:trimethylamine---corrinoid protein Co-methyltransferase